MQSFNLMYLIAIYFFIILIFSESKYRIHSAIILTFTILNICFAQPEATNGAEYTLNRGVNLLWDGVTAWVLTRFLMFDKLAWKQALLLAFAVLCHTTIIYDLTVHSSTVSHLFYSWYAELIITVGILQMVISINGISSALRSIRDNILRVRFYSWCYRKGFSAHKRSGEKS